MSADRLADRRFVWDDEEDAELPRPPSRFAPDGERNDPRLHVESADGLLKVAQFRLDLHYGQRGACLVPGEHVDAAALSEVIERVLESHLPPGLEEPTGNGVYERRVPGVDECVAACTVPAALEVGTDVEAAGDALDCFDRQSREASALDP